MKDSFRILAALVLSALTAVAVAVVLVPNNDAGQVSAPIAASSSSSSSSVAALDSSSTFETSPAPEMAAIVAAPPTSGSDEIIIESTTTTLDGTSGQKSPTTSAPKATSTTRPSKSTTTTQAKSNTTAPSGSFDAVVKPGESIQKAVDRLGAGSRILIASGVHVRQQVVPKTGMSFVGESGAVLDGQNATQYAFYSFSGGANDVTIRGLEIRNYKPSNGSLAAITAHQVSGWRIENCNIHSNARVGVYVGRNAVVRGNHIHHNGSLGVAVTGNKALVESNTVNSNNPNNAADPLWEAGGIKFGGGSSGVVIRKNHVHDNHGPGIWADEGATQSLIEGNKVENNQYSGIDYEISSHAVIRNNTVRNNGHKQGGGWMWGAGIMIRSPHVEVYGNTVDGNYNGIGIIENYRSGVVIDHIRIYNNTIRNSAKWNTGLVRGTSGDNSVFSRSISWDGNSYSGGSFAWMNTTYSLAEWQAAGHN